jgi:hypothetical protein
LHGLERSPEVSRHSLDRAAVGLSGHVLNGYWGWLKPSLGFEGWVSWAIFGLKILRIE